MTLTVTINDPTHAQASKWADWIYAVCRPAVPLQTRGGVYKVDIEAERVSQVYIDLSELSPGDISVRAS